MIYLNNVVVEKHVISLIAVNFQYFDCSRTLAMSLSGVYTSAKTGILIFVGWFTMQVYTSTITVVNSVHNWIIKSN